MPTLHKYTFTNQTLHLLVVPSEHRHVFVHLSPAWLHPQRLMLQYLEHPHAECIRTTAGGGGCFWMFACKAIQQGSITLWWQRLPRQTFWEQFHSSLATCVDGSNAIYPTQDGFCSRRCEVVQLVAPFLKTFHAVVLLSPSWPYSHSSTWTYSCSSGPGRFRRQFTLHLLMFWHKVFLRHHVFSSEVVLHWWKMDKPLWWLLVNHNICQHLVVTRC